MRYFNGAYKLYDDGRRSGKLEIKVDENGDVVGHYYSDKDGKKYEVGGKISNAPQHRIEFRIQYPRTVQTFTGHLFTGDGRAIAGSSTMENLTAGFYALRIERMIRAIRFGGANFLACSGRVLVSEHVIHKHRSREELCA